MSGVAMLGETTEQAAPVNGEAASTVVEVFTQEQIDRLAALEHEIELAADGPLTIGRALNDIRATGLYKLKKATFEDYVDCFWDCKKSRAHQLMDFATIHDLLTARGLPAPVNEAQTRYMAELKDDPDAVVSIWSEVTAGGAKPTGAKVRAAVDQRLGREPKARKSNAPPSDPDAIVAALASDLRDEIRAAGEALEAAGVAPADAHNRITATVREILAEREAQAS